MGSIKDAFDQTYRDFATDGVMASGRHEPSKASIRALAPLIETAIGNAGLGGMVDVLYATRAELNADLSYEANSIGLVYGDAADANNDLYVKSGASGTGAWTLTGALHSVIGGLTEPYVESALLGVREQQLEAAVITGINGSVVEIETAFSTSNQVPVPYTVYRVTIPADFVLPAELPLSISLNGGTAYELFDAKAAAIDPRQIVPGEVIFITWDAAFDGIYRLLYPRKEDTNAPIELVDAGAGPEYAYQVSTRNVSHLPTSGRLYYCRFKKTNQTQPMELSVNGGVSLRIYERDGTNPLPGRITADELYWLRYVAPGDPDALGGAPYWLIVAPGMDLQQSDALFALQEAEQAKLALRRRWEKDNLAAWEAIPRVTLFDHDFASSGDEGKYRWCRDNGTSSGTYDPYSHGSGYIETDIGANGGMFWDANHVWPGRGFLQLPLVLHPSWHTDLAGVTTLRDAKLTVSLRMLNFTLPPGAILAWHYQANIGTDEAPRMVNYLYAGQLVSDLAGFGVGENAGVGWPPLLRSINDTGNFEFVLRFIDDDARWTQLGTSRARALIGGATSPLYTVAPIEDAFDGKFASTILVVLFPQQSLPTLPPQQKATGTLRVNSIKLEVPI